MTLLQRLLPQASRELLSRYVSELVGAWPQITISLVTLAVLVGAASWLSRRVSSRVVQALIVLIGATAAVTAAWQVKWVADDAFISFRYAENFVHGRGLVWNEGERVEGYTNFLWTMLIALGMRVGLDPVQLSVVLGLASFALLVLVVFRLTLQVLPEHRRVFAILPVALTAANTYLVSYGTSGLETMFVTLMVMVALQQAHAQRPKSAAVAAAAAMMAHPDQAILAGALFVAWVADKSQRRQALTYAITLAAVFGSYYVGRWIYYGEFWTNTYYAKSASAGYFAQGLTYLGIALLSGGLWGLLPGLFASAASRTAPLLRRFCLVGLPLFTLYIAKIGGDFMDGRLVTSLLPPAFVWVTVTIAELVPAWPGERRRVLAFVGRALPSFVLAALALTAGLRLNVVRPFEKLQNVADEGSFYRLASFSPPVVANGYYDQGRTLGAAFTSKDVRMAAGCVGMVGYYSKLPMLDQFGLSDKITARMPIATRARPGHEKLARIPRLLEWGAHFSVDPMYPWPYTETGRADISGFPYYIIRYNDEAANELARRGFFSPSAFRTRLSSWIDPATAAQRAPDEAACHAWYVDTVYLTTTKDPAMKARLEEFVSQADPAVGNKAALVFETSAPEKLGYELVRSFPMESFVSSNERRYVLPVGGMIAGQGRVWGSKGPFVNTFTKDGDADVVTLTSPRFQVDGDVITFVVGGGRSLVNEFVGLKVEGRWVRQSSGCEVEALGRRAWDVTPFRGKEAEVVIVDASAGGWGHIEVGDVVLWRTTSGTPAVAR